MLVLLCFCVATVFLVNKDLYIILAFDNEDLVFHIGIVTPLIVCDDL